MKQPRKRKRDVSNIERRIYDADQAGAYLGYSPWSVRELARTGKIPFIRNGRRMLFDIFDLQAWIEAGKVIMGDDGSELSYAG